MCKCGWCCALAEPGGGARPWAPERRGLLGRGARRCQAPRCDCTLPSGAALPRPVRAADPVGEAATGPPRARRTAGALPHGVERGQGEPARAHAARPAADPHLGEVDLAPRRELLGPAEGAGCARSETAGSRPPGVGLSRAQGSDLPRRRLAFAAHVRGLHRCGDGREGRAGPGRQRPARSPRRNRGPPRAAERPRRRVVAAVGPGSAERGSRPFGLLSPLHGTDAPARPIRAQPRRSRRARYAALDGRRCRPGRSRHGVAEIDGGVGRRTESARRREIRPQSLNIGGGVV